jgi:hypothetical protein
VRALEQWNEQIQSKQRMNLKNQYESKVFHLCVSRQLLVRLETPAQTMLNDFCWFLNDLYNNPSPIKRSDST